MKPICDSGAKKHGGEAIGKAGEAAKAKPCGASCQREESEAMVTIQEDYGWPVEITANIPACGCVVK